MNYVKHIASFLMFFCSVSGLKAQEDVVRVWNELDSIDLQTSNFNPAYSERLSRWSYNTSVGTSYSFAPSYGSAMNIFAAPHADFSATNRLSLHGGFIASHTSLLKSYADYEFPYSQGYNSMSVFVAASYRLSENLIIHGTGVKSLMMFPGDMENQNISFDDLSIGATYNFGNFSIGASFHSPRQSFMPSPFGYGNSMFGSPFYW